ncbi:hypothetical protein RchiOBHm_Chr1g0329021 [Rosa chinensis]|uniref:Uncharacterized protein n=1 Tax=Rosa chinensis TaxID=74649 RepID=A0A2P6SAX8_ROSCH|nr:hypothetical protein RchiOBHm_Chr1g0329021 [Rosa chinensis]
MKPPSRLHLPCVVKLWSLAFKIQDQRLKLSTIHPSWCNSILFLVTFLVFFVLISYELDF